MITLTPKTEVRCRHFGPCGGCELQDLPYAEQLALKTANVESLFRQQLPGVWLPPLEMTAMQEPWAYRSKMEFTFGQEEGRILLGLHSKGNFRKIVDLVQCEITQQPVNQALAIVKESANRSGLAAYHNRRHEGFWRFCVVRPNFAGELMLTVITNEGPRQPMEELRKQFQEKLPAVKSFWWGVTQSLSDVARPERWELMDGQERLEDRLGNLRFRFGPANFVQPNRMLAAQAYDRIVQRSGLTGQEAVYDLYCGMGLISLSLAPHAATVCGVESEQANIDLALENASLNDADNLWFVCGKTEDLVKGQAIFKAGAKPDVVVLDPPRVGLHGEVYEPLLKAAPKKLIYLSCNANSLAKDLKMLQPGYALESIDLFDFFAHTPHVEVLVTLRAR